MKSWTIYATSVTCLGLGYCLQGVYECHVEEDWKQVFYYRLLFLKLILTDILGQIFLCCGIREDYCVLYEMSCPWPLPT